jgi:hypothetical protein
MFNYILIERVAAGHTSLLHLTTDRQIYAGCPGPHIASSHAYCTAVLSGGTVHGCLVKETDGFIWKTYGHGRQMDTYGRQMDTYGRQMNTYGKRLVKNMGDRCIQMEDRWLQMRDKWVHVRDSWIYMRDRWTHLGNINK